MTNKKPVSSSHYIHRTSYSFQEKLVGAFVLVAVIILLALLFSLLKKQNLFEDYFVLYGRLNSAAGLSEETTIQISGFEVGSVTNIEITEDNDILLTLAVARKYHNLIRSDSVMRVSSLNATIIGKSVIEITAGSTKLEVMPEGTEFIIQETTSIDTIIAKAQDTLKTVNQVITGVSDVVAAVDAEHIKQTLASINNMASNLSDMSEQIAAGKGGLGSLIYDKELEQSFELGINNLQQATAQLEQMMEKLNTDMDKVPVVIEDVQAVIDETRETLEATQRIWPISSAIDKSEPDTRLVDPAPAND